MGRSISCVAAILTMALTTATMALTTAAPNAAAAPPPEPQIVAPGIISSPAEEYRITFTPDGRTAYFARSAEFFPFSRQATILETRFVGGRWTEPVTASFSGTYPDLDPFITADGSALYFSSIRPVGGVARDDADLWVVHRRGNGSWGAPKHLGDVNQAGTTSGGEPVDELFPSVSSDGTLYVASNRDGGAGGWDLYKATKRRNGTYRPAINLGPAVNTDGWEFNPAVTANGRLMVFTRLSTGGPPWGELQRTSRTPAGWAPPQPLCVNSDLDEYHASFSPDQRQLYFVRRDPLAPDAQGDLYRVPTRQAFTC